ncbi:MAG: LamG-like jellyroll fold domain-containing protein [Tepidisphaeraceae bacterium]
MYRTSLARVPAQQFLARLAVIVVFAMTATRAAAAPLLWNQLGSAAEVTNSGFGPNLGFYGGGGPIDQIGNPAYVPGVFGNALTLGPGSYSTPFRVRNVVWSNVDQHLNANRGTIEAWFKQGQNPVGFSHGIYRIFDGAYGLGSGIGMWSDENAANPRLMFGMDFGGTYTGVSHNISPLNGTWIHLAGVWDRNGIDGSSDTLRLYVNGSVAASTTVAGWGNVVGQFADIAGGNDELIAGKFAVDNLKVYDTALTDFSNRFNESSIPEPSCAWLAGLGVLGLCRWRRGA